MPEQPKQSHPPPSPPPETGKSYPYEVQYGPTEILRVNGYDPATKLYDVDIILKNRKFDPRTQAMYGSPPGPPG